MSTPDGTLDNPYPYSQYHYGLAVTEPTYYVAGVEKFVLEPVTQPDQINTPIWLQLPKPPAEFLAFLKAHFRL